MAKAATPPKARVRKRPEIRRREIMDAAVDVFARKGVSEATIEDVTRQAGASKATFYLYFDSKEELLGALRERFVDEMMSTASAMFERVGQGDWWSLVDATVETFIDMMLGNRKTIKALLRDSPSPQTNEVFAECQRRVTGMFTVGIQAGIQDGAFSTGDPALAASFLHHAIDGAVTEAILYGKPDRNRLVQAAKELARKTLAAK
jgi:AcrR family transcriptional regulator